MVAAPPSVPTPSLLGRGSAGSAGPPRPSTAPAAAPEVAPSAPSPGWRAPSFESLMSLSDEEEDGGVPDAPTGRAASRDKPPSASAAPCSRQPASRFDDFDVVSDGTDDDDEGEELMLGRGTAGKLAGLLDDRAPGRGGGWRPGFAR